MHVDRRLRWMVGLFCGSVLGAALPGAPAAPAGLPTAYNHACVPHQVRLPRLATPADVTTDLQSEPWTRAARLTGNLDWRRIRTADFPIYTHLFYDSESIWIAYRSEVTPGPNLRASVRERDEDLRRDDNVIIEIDVGRTNRVFYRFAINSLGTLTDSVIIDKSWDSTATVRAATDERGWTAVLRVPFSDFNLSEPPVGSVWTFNISSRSGIDNSWAPVLGGYHIPEEFALAVFSGDPAARVRMQEFHPLVIGTNSLRVEADASVRYLFEGVDRHGRTVSRQQGFVGGDGTVRYDLLDEDIKHVNFSFLDADGTALLTFWRPTEIPPVLSKLTSLRDKAKDLSTLLERFPAKACPSVERLLSNAAALSEAPASLNSKAWSDLHEQLVALERPLTDAWLYGQTLARIDSQAGFAVALATPMDKVMIKDFPCTGHVADRYALSLARNEQEAMQVVVIPVHEALQQVRVEASPALAKAGNTPLKGSVTTALVGHVQTKYAGSYLPNYVGWYPDPILHFQQSCDIDAGDHVAFWVNVTADRDARPGDYVSTLTISAEGRKPLQVQLDIRVWDLLLADGTHLRTAFTYTPSNTKRLYGERWSAEIERRYHDFILDHRLNIDSLYGRADLNIELLRYGADRGMNAFNLFYMGKGINPEVARSLLAERMPALAKAGLTHLAYIYGFDEVNDEAFPKMREVFGMVGELYPGLPRMTTGYDNTFGRTTGLRDYVDIWVPLIPEYDMIEAQRLREEGKDMWWYLCVGPRHPYPNFFVESPAIEARLLMGAMSYKHQVGGVLYFMTNGWSLNDEPVSTGPYTNWFPGSGKSRDGVYANGDGSVFCAGPDGPVTTIRYENIRDGLEDYEYLYELARVIEALERQPASLARASFVQRARRLLTVPDSVVESSSRYTYDPRELYAFRNRVAEAILEGRGLSAEANK